MNKQFAEDLQQDLHRGHVLEWAEMYALDAVSDDERAAIEEFLAHDDGLRQAFTDRVRSNRETITTAYAIQEEEPPAGLLEKILSQIPVSAPAGTDGVSGGTEAPAGGPAGAAAAGTAATALGGASAAGDELARRRRTKGMWASPATRWLTAAAAAVLVAVGGVTVAQNLGQTSIEQEVLQASDVVTGSYVIPAGGTAGLALSEEEDAAVVTLKGVPAPPEGSVYQMWRLPADGSAPVSVSTMDAEDVAGTKVTEVEGISSFRGIAITVEPDGGSPVPTTPVIAEIPFRT
ncbi:anti-sigma factor domain-containing protein [Arthrobacter zhaoguopingii]|uniref:anti-sigma factor domain-containing protein n=1 Tax=Arthrobacter zhaoguopingii TaxID=2681491 RepID=UPI00135A3C3D|nr:anti-sigma factor [Arthrobacter zhaoguopingii]